MKHEIESPLDLMHEFTQIQDDLSQIQQDLLPKREGMLFNRAMNRIAKVIADGKRRTGEYIEVDSNSNLPEPHWLSDVYGNDWMPDEEESYASLSRGE
jgi:hypothetical protein